jgi:hypothetical protein
MQNGYKPGGTYTNFVDPEGKVFLAVWTDAKLSGENIAFTQKLLYEGQRLALNNPTFTDGACVGAVIADSLLVGAVSPAAKPVAAVFTMNGLSYDDTKAAAVAEMLAAVHFMDVFAKNSASFSVQINNTNFNTKARQFARLEARDAAIADFAVKNSNFTRNAEGTANVISTSRTFNRRCSYCQHYCTK